MTIHSLNSYLFFSEVKLLHDSSEEMDVGLPKPAPKALFDPTAAGEFAERCWFWQVTNDHPCRRIAQ